MRIASWNVARRASRLPEQAAALAAVAPDVVALQEVTAGTWPRWREALAGAGLRSAACSLDGADPRRAPPGPRRTGVLIAAREDLGAPDRMAGPPWPECSLQATVGGVAIHVIHVPNAANGLVKPQTLAAVRAAAAAAPEPAVVCGDFNTPRRELADGTVWSFARDSKGRLRPARAGFWDEAELGVVPGLRDLGYADAFRALHGYARREPSWVWPHGGGWRLDHLFARGLTPVSAAYAHPWRDAGLSDHSALIAELGERR